MSDLWILCPHQEVERHLAFEGDQHEFQYRECQGGRKATVEEVVEWLREQPGFVEGMTAAKSFLEAGDWGLSGGSEDV